MSDVEVMETVETVEIEEVKEEKKERKKDEKKEEKTYPYTVAIRFHGNSKSYTFGTDLDNIQIGDYVIVQTSQGIEIGKAQTTSVPISETTPKMKLAPVVRLATKKDQLQYRDNIELGKHALRICQEEVEKLGLGMHLLSAEYVLDRSKVLFIYQADARVDFRELLKKLGSRLHCRIELRQIGERDKAKMVGGIGVCGMECCCSRFKTSMDVVSINMAKTQLLALNTEKLSGMCGKLMCCLRYENDNYKELTKGLPKMGAHVEYNGAIYRVASMNVMNQSVNLENPCGFETITLDDLKENAIIRKGVPLTKHREGCCGGNMKCLNERVKESAIASGTYAKKDEVTKKEERRQPVKETKKPRKNSNEKKKPVNKKATDAKNKQNKPQNHKPKRNPKPAPTAKKANVTVRSFKSSKNKQADKNGGK